MLKYTGDLELLVSKYGFEYQGGMYFYHKKNKCAFMGDERVHSLGIDKFRKQIDIPKIDMMRYNLFDGVLDKLYDLIKDGLVEKVDD